MYAADNRAILRMPQGYSSKRETKDKINIGMALSFACTELTISNWWKIQEYGTVFNYLKAPPQLPESPSQMVHHLLYMAALGFEVWNSNKSLLDIEAGVTDPDSRNLTKNA